MSSVKAAGPRKFYQLPETPSPECGGGDSETNPARAKKFRAKGNQKNIRGLMEMVERNVIGRETVFQSPFGSRRCVYMDHTASGQPLRCIEDYIIDHVLPYYGNTHTTSTLTSSQTTMYRHESKDIIRNAVGASEHDAVIFCGSGATAAVHKLINAVRRGTNRPPPIVFIGPYEHHSNIVPWRDAGAKMVYIPETVDGTFDIKYLEEKLKEARGEDVKDRMLIGSFSIASNITGIPTDDVAVTILMHKYGGLAFWDYSAAAPHVQLVMNPVVTNHTEEGLAKKDAMYFSGHKFVGGPQTPGVLVAKKTIFENPIPDGGGGGTVFFVTKDSHRYLQNIEYREEGGTPAIIESIRLGLVFRMKEAVGAGNIIVKESAFAKRACTEWAKTPEIKLLGSANHPRVGILSFLIEHAETKLYLHHNFVVALLNDLFGIQARGGCACAGPYGQSLLGIGPELARQYEELLLEDTRLDRSHLRRYLEGSSYEVFRPGFTRLSIPYHTPAQEVDYVIEAVQLIAEHGYKLLPLYTCNPETGEFHHHSTNIYHNRKWLSWAVFDADGIRYKERQRNSSEDYPNYKECLEQAKTILTNAHNLCKRRTLPDQSLMFDTTAAPLKWFMLPSEALEILNSHHTNTRVLSIKSPMPFQVKTYAVDEERQNTTTFYPNSVPYQLIQSSWGEGGDLLNAAKNALKSDESFQSNSDLYYSSNDNESDPELLISEGATVTGPSVCFTSSSMEKTMNHSLSESSTVSDIIQGNSTPQVGASGVNGIVQEPLDGRNGVLNNGTEYAYSRTESFGSLNQDVFSQDGLSRHNSVEQQQNYNQLQPYPINQVISHNVQQANSLPVNNALNGFVEPQQPQFSLSYPMAHYSNPPNTPSGVVMNQCGQPPPQQMNGNGMFNQQQSFDMTNFSFSPSPSCQNYPANSDSGMMSTDASWGHMGSPAMTPSPVPTYQQMNPVCMGMLDPNQNIQVGVVNNNNNLPYSLPVVQAAPVNVASQTATPTLASPTNSNSTTYDNELMQQAMRRVTKEIANELKSEIRGVISQVEQGIDDACRERANSYSAKDKKMEALKKRARTMSGHTLRFRRSDTTDGLSPDKSESTSDSSVGLDAAHSTTGKGPGQCKQKGKPKEKGNVKRDSCKDAACMIKRESQENKPVTADKRPSKWHAPPKNVLKPTLTALNEYSMIKDGDKILVCLSGGKDSLSLLHTIRQLQFIMAKSGINFTFGATTVDPKHSGYDPRPLIPYLESLGVPYFFEEQEIMPQAMEKGPENVTSICSFCSRMKRGRIYACARRNGYNVLALGQHLDDLAESFFMSVFHNGLMRTMKASYTVKEGDLRVIRPFAYVREKSLRDFAESRGLPIIPENCPACFDAPTERHRVKQLLAQQEILFPKLYLSLRAAMRPLMAIDRTGMESGRKNVMPGTYLNDDEEA